MHSMIYKKKKKFLRDSSTLLHIILCITLFTGIKTNKTSYFNTHATTDMLKIILLIYIYIKKL